MDPENSMIKSIEDVRADIGDPENGTKELHQLKAKTMELSIHLGLPHIEMLWSRESCKYRYLVTVTKKEDNLNAHIWDTITGARYDDAL
jgi:hypothetical protein